MAVPGPALEPGQAFENIGGKTLFWYAPWWGGFISAASWVRDRLGYFEVVTPQTPQGDKFATETNSPGYEAFKKMVQEPAAPHFISCPLQVNGPDLRIFINADGLSAESNITLELLDEKFNPLPRLLGERLHSSDSVGASPGSRVGATRNR